MNLKSIVTALTVVASCGIMWAGTAGNAVAASGVVAVDEPKTGPDRSRRVCRSLRPTGSRLPERVCRTQREWDDDAQKTRDGMDDSARNDTIQNLREQGPR